MVSFEDGLLVNQFFGNSGMLEIYVDIFSGVFLFLSSIICLLVSSFMFGRSVASTRTLLKPLVTSGVRIAGPSISGWQSVSAGVLYAGLIGLGEAMEHLTSNILSNFFHYLALVAPPVALYFLYAGIKKHVRREMETVMLPQVILGTIFLFAVVILLAVLTEFYTSAIEEFFLYFALLPVLVFSFFVLRISIEAYTKYLLFIPHVAGIANSTTLFAFVIIVSRIAYIHEYAEFYLITNGLKDITVSVIATLILVYTGGMQTIAKQY